MVIPPKARLAFYGLTEEQYVELWEQCGGRCPLCGRKFARHRPACIDHDHRTWEVRGLLCGPCNYQVGVLHDNLSWLEAAARYLRTPPTLQLWKRAPRLRNAPPVMEDD
jgi:hypothetical protein